MTEERENFREQFEKMFQFDGKVAVVAGGCGGIGSVISQGLAQLGATVVIVDHEEDKACQCAEDIEKQGDRAFAIGFEITQPDSIQAMIAQTVKDAGGVDILVNCVGMHIEKP